MTAKLPIEDVLPALKAKLATHRAAVLEAPPGAGKTTLVPLALRNEPWVKGRKILMLEPRRIAARAARIPFVTTYHGAYNEKSAWKRRYNAVMASGDLVIANSAWTARLVRERYATPDARLVVVPRGVDVARFEPSAIAPGRLAALRASWRLSDTDRVILHPARLTAWKGQPPVIAAAAELAASGRLGDGLVILAGDDQGRTEYRQRLEADIRAAGLGDRVRLVGHCADMPAAFAVAHVALVASVEPEAFGRTATEAEAAGCPVIATAIGAPPETVLAPPAVPASESTGWLVPPADPAALADALATALALSPADRSAIGARATAHVARAFTLDAMQARTLAVYDRLLSTRLEAAFASAGGGKDSAR